MSNTSFCNGDRQAGKTRETNIELLRCVCMFMIMCVHFKAHGLKFEDESLSLMNASLRSFTNWMGSVSNYCFMLITGYFAASSSFSIKKEARVYLQYFFYSALFGLYLFIFQCNIHPQGEEKIMDLKHLAASFLPFLTNQNWYACAYLVFFPFTPFLNKLIDNLTQKEHFKLCMIFLFFGGVIQVLPVQKAFSPEYLFYFVTFYFIGFYINKYKPACFEKFGFNLAVTLLLIFFMTCGSMTVYFLSSRIGFIKNHYEYFFTFPCNVFLEQILAVFLFCTFKSMNIKSNRIINTLGSCTFGIYLIHNNRTFKHYMWFNIFHSQEHIYSEYLPLYLIACVLILFFAAALIELLRKHLFILIKRTYNKVWSYHYKTEQSL